jgi:hypothetical protein
MFKRKLRQWNLVKNLRARDMEQILQSIRVTNEDLQKRSSDREISVDGHKVRLSDLKRYIRRRDSSRTASPEVGGITTQPIEPHHKLARQTEYLVGSDSMPTMTLPGSPLPPLLEIDGLCSSRPTELPSGPMYDHFAATQSIDLVLFGAPRFEDSSFLDVDATSTDAGDGESAMDMEASECSSGGPRMNLQDPNPLFACPFYKYDPARYSQQNALESRYRKCATVVLPSLPRLK